MNQVTVDNIKVILNSPKVDYVLLGLEKVELSRFDEGGGGGGRGREGGRGPGVLLCAATIF